MATPPTRVLGGVAFELVGELDPDRSADGSPIEFMPQSAYARAATSRLNPHGQGPFCRLRIAQGVRQPGLYAVLRGDDVLYVGIALSGGDRAGTARSTHATATSAASAPTAR